MKKKRKHNKLQVLKSIQKITIIIISINNYYYGYNLAAWPTYTIHLFPASLTLYSSTFLHMISFYTIFCRKNRKKIVSSGIVDRNMFFYYWWLRKGSFSARTCWSRHSWNTFLFWGCLLSKQNLSGLQTYDDTGKGSGWLFGHCLRAGPAQPSPAAY